MIFQLVLFFLLFITFNVSATKTKQNFDNLSNTVKKKMLTGVCKHSNPSKVLECLEQQTNRYLIAVNQFNKENFDNLPDTVKKKMLTSICKYSNPSKVLECLEQQTNSYLGDDSILSLLKMYFENLSNHKSGKIDNNHNNMSKEKDKIKIEELEKELAELKSEKIKRKELISTDLEPPQIEITNSSVNNKQGTIKGRVIDNVEVAELTINGRKVNISNNGFFEQKIFVPQDGIKVVLIAIDYSGLTTNKNILLERKNINQDGRLIFAKLNPLNIKGNKNEDAFALIIGVSEYDNAPEAKYADRDAAYFADFAETSLGIPKHNIKLISNKSANENSVKKALKIWLKGYSTPNHSDIYIFFAGHGLASIDGKDLYLLPYDVEPSLLEDTALLISEIYDTIESNSPKSVTVFLDACYSGKTRNNNMILEDSRPITIVPIKGNVPNNFTVFSSSSGSEISSSLPEADHGLFSYFLMKGLEGNADANNDKKITNAELYSYVRSNVTRQAMRLGREQTPQLQGDENRVLVEFN